MLRRHLIIAMLCALGAHARADTLVVPQDFPTIQAALDAAVADDVVLIHGGLYAESPARSLPANVTIKGKGNVRIDAAGLGAGLTVDGQGLQVIGVKVIGGTDGMVLGGTQSSATKCSVSDVSDRGFVLNGTQQKLENCKVKDAGGTGIAVLSGAQAVLKKCKVSDAGGSGLTFGATCVQAYVFKLRVLRPGVDGLVNDGGGGVVAGARIVDAAARGIVDNALAPQHGNAYVDCTVVKPGAGGLISTGNASQLQLGGCIIQKPGATGIDVAGASARVEHCKVTSAGADGLRIGGTDGTWTSNSSTKAAGNGFVLDGTGNLLSLNVGQGSGGFDLLDNQPGLNIIADDNDFGTIGP
jgi:hypothetical protein